MRKMTAENEAAGQRRTFDDARIPSACTPKERSQVGHCRTSDWCQEQKLRPMNRYHSKLTPSVYLGVCPGTTRETFVEDA